MLLILMEVTVMNPEHCDDEIKLLKLMPLINRTILTPSGIRELGYTKTQLTILAALSLRGDLTMSQIAGFISSSKEQATRAVAPLVDHKLAERFTNPENRTHIHIRLTEKGQEFVALSFDRFRRHFRAQLEEKVTPVEQQELFQSVDSLLRILGKLG